jgi:GST-like protein
VLEVRLQNRDWIVNDDSIADIPAFPRAFIAKPLGASLDAHPGGPAWRQRLKSRPAVCIAIDLYKSDQ